MTFGIPGFCEILKGQVYLGNLSAALSQEVQKKLGITHIVSVCSEYSSTSPNHLTIPVDDSEYEDILIRLPEACEFIQSVMDQGGRVFVHCVMGVSRSATVVAAYLMKTRHISRTAAIRFIKQRRPQVHPNYGFIQQLETFAECHYNPTLTDPIYCKWKRRQQRLVTQFLNQMVDTTSIIPNQLLVSSEFPDDKCQAESLIQDAGITHLLSISPAKIPMGALPSPQKHRHIELFNRQRDQLLLALPDTCDFIHNAIENGGQVLVHCQVESTACIVVCAFLMSIQRLPINKVLLVLQDALPLFNLTKSFISHLEIFEACLYHPEPDSVLVQEWVASSTSPISTPVSAIHSDICSLAASVMSETALDMKAFGDVLEALQNRQKVS